MARIRVLLLAVAVIAMGSVGLPTLCLGGAPAARAGAANVVGGVKFPDLVFTNQLGQPVRLREALAGRSVALQFIFTRCQTICPLLSANFSEVGKALGDSLGRETALYSISVDPAHDSPAVLREWGDRFGRKPGWDLLTGSTHDVDSLLKALRVATAVREDHSPLVLVGADDGARWIRLHGLSSPSEIARQMTALRPLAAPSKPPGGLASGAGGQGTMPSKDPVHPYFPDVELVDHEGRKLRLYSDLMHGRTVLVSTFFTSCTGVCPALNERLRRLKAALDRLGAPLEVVSITVDPATDGPERIREYAKKFGTGPGWHFVTGSEDNVRLALSKFGLAAKSPDQHSNLFIVGNDRTGLWKKVFALADEDEVLGVVKGVVNDTSVPAK